MTGQTAELGQALSLMEAALEILDRLDRAHDVGAHLDLAIHRLKEFLKPVADTPWPEMANPGKS